MYEEQICRLCLNVADNEFELIDENIRKMFDILLLKVNLDISKDPVICKECAKVAEKCFNFKAICRDTEELIFSFAIGKNCSTFNIKDIYKYGQDIKAVDEDSTICRFCMNHLIGKNCVLLDKLIEDVRFAKMLLLLIPETDFDIIKNPFICVSCIQHLEFYMKFVEHCSATEEKITKYYQNECTAEVNLSDLLHFMIKNDLKSDCTQTDVMKQEVLEDIEVAQSEEYQDKLIKVEEIAIKDEEVIPISNSIPSEIKIVKAYKMEYKGEANKKNDNIHNNITRVEKYKCSMCTYETKHKRYLKKHTLIHKDITEVEMYKCSMCTYQTKHKRYLKKHMLIHKDITEVEIYKCSMCTYQARHKRYLVKHMLIHKDITEVEMYKCSMCTYQTKHKRYLVKHMLIHKDITEVEMYKCSMCTYQARQKTNLKGHMLIHKDIPEVEMYKCSMCTYQTKQKTYLKKHMIIHKDITEVEMYKCSMCTYETKHKRYLKTHMLSHKDVSEVKMYKCSMCTYQVKRNSRLKRHIMLMHE